MSADKLASPWLRNAAYAAMAAAIFAFPLLVGNTFHIHIAQTLLYTTIAVIGLNMLLGLSGQMSLGQAGFYAIGAYGSALLTAKLGWPIAAGMLAGILLAGLAGCLVGLVALRTRGLYLAMATLAFGFMTEIAAQRWVDLTGGTMGVYGVPALDFAFLDNGQDLLPVGGRCRLPRCADRQRLRDELAHPSKAAGPQGERECRTHNRHQCTGLADVGVCGELACGGHGGRPSSRTRTPTSTAMHLPWA